MTQSSEERVPQSPDPIISARIIPFERPQNELQRAVLRRAQEHIEAESVKPKTSKVRKLVTFAAALVPVALTFSGFLLAVHAVRIITSLYATPETPAPAAPPAVESQQESVDPEQPGVVILMPEKSVEPAPGNQTSSEDRR
jgi:hypothetical protein